MFAAGWVAVEALTDVFDSLLTILAFHLSPVVLVAPKTGIRSHIDRHRAVVTADAALHTATRVGHHLCLGQNCVLRVKDWCSTGWLPGFCIVTGSAFPWYGREQQRL